MPKVSDEHKDGVRRRIMDAALACLARNHYQGVTTRQLVAEAGVSTGTIYNYFPSKELLYEALAEELLAADVGRLGDVTAAGPGTGERLWQFLTDEVLGDVEGAVAVASFRGRMDASGDAREAITRLNGFVARAFTPLVDRARAEGYVRDDIDPAAVVELLDIIWDGLGRRQAAGSFQTSYQRVGDALVQLLRGGLVTDRRVAAEVPGPRAPTPKRR